jgi:mono/diheme cytochrome c family protein
MGRLLLGIILGLLLAPLAVLGWFKFGTVPVAVADAPLPQERLITGVPLHARIDREAPQSVPIQADENNLVAGAEIYRDQCAACHGYHGRASSFGAHMFPDAPPLWEAHHHGSETTVGVSDDPTGETYWKVANGIRLTGMPAYKTVLTETQMWQVSVLLANADKPMPGAAVAILKGEPARSQVTAPAPASAKKE